MSSPVSDQKFSQAKKERDFYEVKVETAELKKDLRQLLKGVGEDPGVEGGARPVDRIREATISALEVKAFQDALGGNNGREPSQRSTESSVKQTRDFGEARLRIVEALAKAGKKPEEIEQYLTRLGPLLDTAGLAQDPIAQVLLYSRFGQNPSEMQLKDVVETVKLIEDMKKGSGGKSEAAELATAFAEVFKAGREQIQQANPGMSPFEAFQEGMKQMQGLMSQQTETVKTMFNDRIKTLEEKIAANDPIGYVKSMREAADTLGWGGTDKEIELQKLQSQDKRADREFEREKTLWDMEKKEKAEERKDKRQAKMIDRIMDGVGTALESPVIKEAGKYVGSKMEGKVPDIRGQAARSQLADPTQELLDFTCPKCNKKYEFTNAELIGIQGRGGRWVCSTQGCGAAYTLPKEGGVKK